MRFIVLRKLEDGDPTFLVNIYNIITIEPDGLSSIITTYNGKIRVFESPDEIMLKIRG